TCLLGVFTGLVLKNERMAGGKKALTLLGVGVALVLAGHLWGEYHPVIKNLWTSSFVVLADAWSSGAFVHGNQSANMKAVLDDILGHGNEKCLLPGQIEAGFRKRSDAAGGLLFTNAELAEFKELADEIGQSGWGLENFPEESA
ncbi:hypothetical protein N9198_05305, partial [Akkermansiaceae bacterium]|nr:hypothetical protein [Akkermansiaceae bacterium]